MPNNARVPRHRDQRLRTLLDYDYVRAPENVQSRSRVPRYFAIFVHAKRSVRDRASRAEARDTDGKLERRVWWRAVDKEWWVRVGALELRGRLAD